jgi:general secretion pathway protein N
MKRRIISIAGALALFATFLIALLPAQVAINWFAPPLVRYSDVTGTVWSGSISNVAIGDTPIGRVNWSEGSIALLIGRPAWQIELSRPDGFVRSSLSLRTDTSVIMRDADATGSLQSLASVLPLYGTTGNVTVRVEELILREGKFEYIKGRIVIDQLKTNALKSGDLGAVVIEFPGEESAPLTGILAALEGPLQIRDGQIRLTPEGSYEIEGRVAATQDAPREIVDALQYLGRPDSEGYRLFSQAGSF